MPGPALSKTFTYDGTPGNKDTSITPRFRRSTLRFFDSKDTGTHSRVDKRVNIPKNSFQGIGIGPTVRTVQYGNDNLPWAG